MASRSLRVVVGSVVGSVVVCAGFAVVPAALAVERSGSAASVDAPRSWSATRVLRDAGSPATDVQVVTARNAWELVAREVDSSCTGCPATYRLRERVPGRGWSKPQSIPAQVQSLAWTNTPSGAVYVCYVRHGRLWVAFKSPRGPSLFGPVDLGPAQAGQVAQVTAAAAGVAIVDYGDTWYRQDGNEPWYGQPQPAQVPADAKVFTTAYGGALWFSHRGGQLVVDGSGLAAAQVLGPAADAEYVELDNDRGDVSARIVTRDLDGERRVRVFDADADLGSGPSPRQIGNARDLGASGGPVQVRRDDGPTLTVAFPEPASDGRAGGTLVWQDDRPRSSYLSRPTRIPGTRGVGDVAGSGAVDVEVSRNGTVSVAYPSDASGAGPVLVRRLPAGSKVWSRATRIETPKPARRLPGFDLGTPRSSDDVTLVVNDRAGVVAFTYDAPRPRTRAR